VNKQNGTGSWRFRKCDKMNDELAGREGDSHALKEEVGFYDDSHIQKKVNIIVY
jgi:hypothetical protein